MIEHDKSPHIQPLPAKNIFSQPQRKVKHGCEIKSENREGLNTMIHDRISAPFL